jgi:putative tryptophan/tyrosine transport system substrate-binding protein
MIVHRVITRRTALAMLPAAMASYTTPLRAQAPLRRVGVLGTGDASYLNNFRAGLGRLGWVEGRNVEIVHRITEGNLAGIDAAAAELVAAKVEVIVATATPSIQAAMRATRGIPIVMMSAGDALASGLVQSLARPGGNVTGMTLMLSEIAGKLVELLVEIMPDAAGIGCLAHGADPLHRRYLQGAERAAVRLGRRFHPAIIGAKDELPARFAEMSAAGIRAALIQPILTLTGEDTARIAGLAATHRIATISSLRRFAREGGMLVYAAQFSDPGERGARFVDQILRGANPAELPVEQPTEFALVVNLRAAAAIGLAIPAAVLARADEVIE